MHRNKMIESAILRIFLVKAILLFYKIIIKTHLPPFPAAKTASLARHDAVSSLYQNWLSCWGEGKKKSQLLTVEILLTAVYNN